jgi:methyl-accepting chemotaxis protein
MKTQQVLMAVSLSLSCLLAPAAALAAERPPLVIPESLPAQDKEMLQLAADTARRCGEILEKWINAKEVTEERLFSYIYYPVDPAPGKPRIDPPKFTTDYDKLSDRDILPVEEAALTRSSALFFVVMVDKNGYLPTHNARYSQPLTYNLAADLANNRTKRIFNDRTGIAAAKSEAPFLIQRYQRDTGENMIDLSVPVYVRGKHWGALRLGYRQAEK